MREKENRLEWKQQHVQCDGLAEVRMVSLVVGELGWGWNCITLTD